MYMAPIVKAKPVPSHPVIRRLVGVPVLAIAGAVALPWVALQAMVAGVALAGRGLVQAVDYAGTIALGR